MSERIVRLGFNQHGVLEWRVEPPVVVAGGPNLNVTHYRVRDDDISSPNNTPTWLGNEDSNPTAARQTGTANSFVVRFQLDESNNKSGSWTLQLNYNYNSGTATGTVGSASSYVRMYGATSRGGISDNAAITTSRLTSATGTFENGICDTATGAESFNNSSNGAWTEYEWIVYIVDADVSNGDTINLYLTGQNGSSVGGPTVTVSKVTTVQGSATLTGSADTSGTADVTHYGTATVTGSADFTATGHIDAFGDATVTGSAELSATATVTHYGTATLTGSADLTATGIRDPFWDETFEGTGYKESWSPGESVEGTAVVDEDYSTGSITGAPASWGSQALRIVTDPTSDSEVNHDAFGDLTVAYTRAEFIVGSHSIASGNYQRIVSWYDSAQNALMHAQLLNHATNGLTLDCWVYYDGSAHSYSQQISLDTPYCVELYWNTTSDVWELRLNESTLGSGSLSGVAVDREFDWLRLGTAGSAALYDAEYYLDNVGVSTLGWLGKTFVEEIFGSATLTGSADTSGTASVQHFASLVAAGAAFLVATASVTHNAQATLTGSADVTGTGVTNEYGTALLTGTADLFGTATLYLPSASATLTGSADVSATASVQHFASATLTGSADLSGTGTLGGEAFGEATVTGSADLAATASVVHYAVATLTGAADVSGTGSLGGSAAGEATLTGTGHLTALASVQHYASAVLTGSADLSGTGWVHVWGDATLTGSADLSGTGVVNEYGTCLLTGTADLFGTATLTLPSASATATGSADVSASASVQHYGAASLTGQASVSGSGTVEQGTVYGSATLTGSAEVVATAYFASVSSDATLTGSAEVVATGWLSKVGGVATLTGKAYAWAGDYPGQGYFAYLYNGEYFRLAKWSPLTGLVILDEVAFVHTPSTYYNIVLEADGNTLNAKVWEGNPNIPPGVADDENEPVGWMISTTDPDYAGGTPGLVALGTADVKFDVFSTGLGGSTYPLGRLPGAPTWVTPSVPFSVPENDPIVPLSWLRPYMTGDVLGGVVNYELEYKREADSEWTFLTSTNETSYDWDLSRYPNSSSYCVRVRAYVGCEYGPWAEICGIGWGGQAPTFETPDGYYFGDDNVGEPDHGMWIRLFQASHQDDEYPVYSCLVTRELLLGGVGGECLFKKLYVNLTYSTAGQCVVTPILDGERVTEETRFIDLDPGEGIATRRFEIDLTRGYDQNGTERFRYGLRGSYFQVEICVTDISGTGRIEIDGIELMYTPARETHTWARPFYGELEVDIQPDINPGYFFGTETDDVGAAIYELATNDRDFGRELRVRLQPRAVAPFGTAMEAWFRTLYICVTRSNTTDGQLKVTPIIDGTELEAEYVTLTGTTQPKTEVLEVPLKIRYPSSTLERSTYGIRGLWFTYRIETVGGRPDGELSFDGCAVEAIPSRETEPGVT